MPTWLGINDSAAKSILPLLFATHAIYQDRESRLAVQKCLSTIVARGTESNTVAALVKALRQESQKPGIAASSSFVLLEWCSLLMQQLAGTEKWDQFGNELLLCIAHSLEHCLQAKSKKSLAHSAIVVTRRGLRKLFGNPQTAGKLLQEAVKLLATKSSQPTARNAPLLGVISGVSSRINKLKPAMEPLKPQFYEFYTREVIGSRTAVTEHVASGLRDFFHDYATIQEIEKDIVPALEKGLLRAPEVILTSVLRPFVKSLPPSFDLSDILSKRLLKPLLSSIKSSNSLIRDGASAAFQDIVPRCQNTKALDTLVDEILLPLKSGKLASADHRALHSQMLQSIPLSKSSAEKILTGIAAIAAKEGNETALAAETSVFAAAGVYTLATSAEIPKGALDVLVKGLSEKKSASRRYWILRTGQMLQASCDQESNPGSVLFMEAVIPKLVDNFNEVAVNAATSVQNGLIVGAYILAALTPQLEQRLSSLSAGKSLQKVSVSRETVAPGAKHSFLLSHRIYGKITSEEDLHWLRLSLSALSTTLDEKTDKPGCLVWSEAFIHLIAARNIPSKIQQESAKALFHTYIKNPRLISSIIIDALWQLLAYSKTKDKEQNLGEERLIHVLRSICPETSSEIKVDIDSKVLEDQACALLVVGGPRLVPKSSWISLCLRMGIDPGSLAQNYHGALLQEIQRRASDNEVSQAGKCTSKLLAPLTFLF
jgi:hypothetical protein